VQREAAKSPAEQSHRDRNEGEVVPDCRRINARQADLENQARKSNQEDSEMNEHW
jgi:hypothetical protein